MYVVYVVYVVYAVCIVMCYTQHLGPSSSIHLSVAISEHSVQADQAPGTTRTMPVLSRLPPYPGQALAKELKECPWPCGATTNFTEDCVVRGRSMRWGFCDGTGSGDWYCRFAARKVPALAGLSSQEAAIQMCSDGDVFQLFTAKRNAIIAKQTEVFESKGGASDIDANAPSGQGCRHATKVEKTQGMVGKVQKPKSECLPWSAYKKLNGGKLLPGHTKTWINGECIVIFPPKTTDDNGNPIPWTFTEEFYSDLSKTEKLAETMSSDSDVEVVFENLTKARKDSVTAASSKGKSLQEMLLLAATKGQKSQKRKSSEANTEEAPDEHFLDTFGAAPVSDATPTKSSKPRVNSATSAFLGGTFGVRTVGPAPLLPGPPGPTGPPGPEDLPKRGRPVRSCADILVEQLELFKVARDESPFFNEHADVCLKNLRRWKTDALQKEKDVATHKAFHIIERIVVAVKAWTNKRSVSWAVDKFDQEWLSITTYAKEEPRIDVSCDYAVEISLSASTYKKDSTIFLITTYKQ